MQIYCQKYYSNVPCENISTVENAGWKRRRKIKKIKGFFFLLQIFDKIEIALLKKYVVFCLV